MRIGIIGHIPPALLASLREQFVGVEIQDGHVVRELDSEDINRILPPAPTMVICREEPGEPVEKHPDVTGVYDRRKKRW